MIEDYQAYGKGKLYFNDAYEPLLALQERYVLPLCPQCDIPRNYQEQKSLIYNFFEIFNTGEHGFKFIIDPQDALDLIKNPYKPYCLNVTFNGIYFDTFDLHMEYCYCMDKSLLVKPEGHIIGFLTETRKYMTEGSYINFTGEDGQKFIFHVGDFIKL